MIPIKVMNYMVPATSSPNALAIREVFSATPVVANFNNVELNGIPFRPSGVYIDNSEGTEKVTVVINEISLTIAAQPGEFLAIPYPAPLNHTASIYGDGLATLVFVDYPVLPYSSAQLGGGGSSSTNNGYDTNGDPLPAQFATAPQAFTYYVDGNLATVTVAIGADSWVQTLGYDLDGNLISQSGWVKQ